MARRKKYIPQNNKFSRQPEMKIDNFIVEQGEIIKIQGEHGGKFRFANLVTNTETGVQWVDCYELYKGVPGGTRAFRIDRVKRIPRRRKRRVVN